MNIGKNIKQYREKYDIGQQELAKRVGISPAMISYIEKGVKTPSLAVADSIAKALHCKVDDLIREEQTA